MDFFVRHSIVERLRNIVLFSVIHTSYLAGDVAKLKACDFTKAECEFIAEAVSIFGGYDSYEKLVEDELRYGREIKKDGEVL